MPEDIYRSADMTYVQLYVPLETARGVVCLLGSMGLLMFRDLNARTSEFQRSYVQQLRQLEDTQRFLAELDAVASRHAGQLGPPSPPAAAAAAAAATVASSGLDDDANAMHDIAAEIQHVHERVQNLDASLSDVNAKLAALVETRYIVFKAARFLEVNPGIAGRISRDDESFSFSIDSEPSNAVPNNDNDDSGMILGSGIHAQFMVLGAVRRDRVPTLNRILWRLLRGNLYFHNIPIEEQLLQGGGGADANTPVDKDCVIIFTHGEALIAKVRRVVESLGGTTVPLDREHFPQTHALNDEITDLQQISQSTEQALLTELLVVNDQILAWNATVHREKCIYATLNLFRQETHGLVAEGWLPDADLTDLQLALRDFGESVGSEFSTVVSVIHTNKSPPTFHRTNKFTGAFQAIVDAYGIATYQEINPGLATITTFPFMFAIMFGDMGHGLILFMIAAFLILNERKFGAMIRDEIFDMAFTGRYVLVLMGFFSMYTGLMYNDMFSKPLTLFKSGWEWPSSFKEGENISAKSVGTYPFGLDWGWHSTENALLFSNSYKMKLSILMGFIHMTYSYMFSYINYKRRGSRVDIIGNFIPGLIFMQSIFGYLSWAIVFKWSKDWVKDGKAAPGLLNMLINMFLAPGKIDEPLYKGQAFLQQVLLLAALVCVPWLLLYKPLTLRKQNNNAKMRGYENIQDQNADHDLMEAEQRNHDETNGEMVITDFGNDNQDDDSDGSGHGHGDAEFNFGDIMIHQVIHTIEFCLNCISHTASYLRLWALSLAHAQLSSVLWDMTIQNSFTSKNSGSPLAVFTVFFLFAMWFVLTVCVLVLMEGTSAMLHALRLHWVEAMSKFFEGEGYAYEPFSFSNLMESTAE
ncbi:H(+)-transporting V0 sector ATPase subunit A [Maudiozyma humilis]|uniref:V-type proton ATPase subunit a n=1 Tax=Maudiozyma humilis TaxID=51915 RepID=A0AAV5S2B7_MAUHU|nr:H(+)-transporting V0 sector ATPase subunit A [Kazachstania humilis]